MAIDTRLRGSGAGMRRAATDLTEAARQYGEICERPNQFFALTHLAAAYRLLGKADSALVTYQRAMDVGARLAPLDTVADMRTFRHVIGGPATARATVAHYIGDVYRDLGRPDSAIAYYRRGEGFVRNEFDVNLQELDESGPDADAPERRSNRNVPTQPHATLASIADAFRDMGRIDSALAYYRKALELARVDTSAARIHFVGYGEMNMHEARYESGMGAAFIDAGLADSALASFGRAQALARNWPLGQWAQRRARIDVLDGIGRALALLGRTDSSLVVQAEALAQARRLGDGWGETRALHAIGKLYHRARAPGGLGSAIAYYDSAAAAFASLSGFAGGDANRNTVAERGNQLIEDWTLAVLAQPGDGNVRARYVAALAVAERGRAQALLRLIGNAPAASPRPSPGATAADGMRIVLGVQRTGTPAVSWMATRDTLVGWLLRKDGGVEVRRTAVSRDSLGMLVANLRTGLDVDDAATRGRLGVRTGASGSEERASNARAVSTAGAARADSATARESARALASLLIPAEWSVGLDSAREVVVVPHGPIALIPFAALPFGPQASGSGASSEWGARFAVRQAPSLATLIEVEARRAPATATGPRRFSDPLIVGNPTMPRVAGEDGLSELLPALPESGTEARWISDRIGVTAFIGGAATERTIRARLPRAQLVHLATHGFAFASDARARDSYVALAPDSASDGMLTVGEIMDDPSLRLTSELVVLSACQTGLGDLKDAEGTIGLPRAFLARGARSVVVSLWSVSDAATRQLMERFYAHWLDDADHPSKAIALQRAAADVRSTAGFEHPRYWAGFQVVGAR